MKAVSVRITERKEIMLNEHIASEIVTVSQSLKESLQSLHLVIKSKLESGQQAAEYLTRRQVDETVKSQSLLVELVALLTAYVDSDDKLDPDELTARQLVCLASNVWPGNKYKVLETDGIIAKGNCIHIRGRVFQIRTESNIFGILVWNKKIVSGFGTISGLRQSLVKCNKKYMFIYEFIKSNINLE